MKTILVDLQAQIEDGTICYIFTVTSKNGDIVRMTDHDVALTFNGAVFTPSAGIERVKMDITNNTEVSNQQVTAAVLNLPGDELGAGKWDYASIEIALIGWSPVTSSKVIIFKGNLANINFNDKVFTADITNYLERLKNTLGSAVTANCRHQLFENSYIGKCGVAKSSFLVSGSVEYVLTNKYKFKCSTGKANGWATSGTLTFTSGNLSGITYPVKIHEVAADPIGESVELFVPTIMNFSVGDTFTLYAGCDKTLDTCKSKFNNVLNFGGFPHLQPDTAISTVIV